jgi:hypothetical protein
MVRSSKNEREFYHGSIRHSLSVEVATVGVAEFRETITIKKIVMALSCFLALFMPVIAPPSAKPC